MFYGDVCWLKVEVILDEAQLREEVDFLKRTLRTKRRLALVRADRAGQPSPAKTRPPYKHTSAKITLLMDWVCAVCHFYHIKVKMLFFIDVLQRDVKYAREGKELLATKTTIGFGWWAVNI